MSNFILAELRDGSGLGLKPTRHAPAHGRVPLLETLRQDQISDTPGHCTPNSHIELGRQLSLQACHKPVLEGFLVPSQRPKSCHTLVLGVPVRRTGATPEVLPPNGGEGEKQQDQERPVRLARLRARARATRTGPMREYAGMLDARPHHPSPPARVNADATSITPSTPDGRVLQRPADLLRDSELAHSCRLPGRRAGM